MSPGSSVCPRAVDRRHPAVAEQHRRLRQDAGTVENSDVVNNRGVRRLVLLRCESHPVADLSSRTEISLEVTILITDDPADSCFFSDPDAGALR